MNSARYTIEYKKLWKDENGNVCSKDIVFKNLSMTWMVRMCRSLDKKNIKYTVKKEG